MKKSLEFSVRGAVEVSRFGELRVLTMCEVN